MVLAVFANVQIYLLSLPTSNDSTEKSIFQIMDDELKNKKLLWSNCLTLGADNASVIWWVVSTKVWLPILLRSKVKYILLAVHAILLHIAAETAAKILHIWTDEILVGVYYYLNKSSKRYKALQDCQILGGSDTHKILKSCSTKWLSLGVSRLNGCLNGNL